MKVAYHVWWTATSKRTGEAERRAVIDRPFAYASAIDSRFEVVERELLAADYWDFEYGPEWQKARRESGLTYWDDVGHPDVVAKE